MNESQIVFFVLTSLFVIMVPGQDLVLVMSKGMTQGAKAGIASYWITSRPLVIKLINRMSGVVLIGLGIKLAFEKR